MHDAERDTPQEPSALLVAVFEEHERRWGEPSMHYGFGGSPGLPLARLDVFVWRPTGDQPMTTLATIGMSDRAMHGCAHRAELHLTLRGCVTDADEAALATFLANLAAWPHRSGSAFDWWHLLRAVGAPPGFPHCPHGLLHPRLVPEGWDAMLAEGAQVKFLNYIPLTNREMDDMQQLGVQPALDRMYARSVDLFSDRVDDGD